MSIHQRVKETLTQHKSKIEAFQMASMAGVASLVYSEYIRRMKQKQVPVHKIMVVPIRSVQEFLKPDGRFMEVMSEELIDYFDQSMLFHTYKDAPELELFQPQNIEILKTIFDLYIIPNMARRIPETIAIKFQLAGDVRSQMFIENYELDLFNRQPLSSDMFRYVGEQAMLQLLMLIPTMAKSVQLPEENIKIQMARNDILTIENPNAICPIHFNDTIIANKEAMELLEFVTNTSIITHSDEDDITGLLKDGRRIQYTVTTNNFNRASVTKLEGIKITSDT